MKETTQLYQHIRLDTGEIFYIGIGNGRRPWIKHNRNAYWHNIVNKAGYRVEILEEGLSWYQACELEKMLIALHGRKDLGYGPLVNMTDGGDGNPSPSAETRAKQSAGNKGKIITEAHREKLRKPKSDATCALLSSANKGKPLSDDRILAISAGTRGLRWVNNGTLNKKLKGEELASYLASGWSIGRIFISWNKDQKGAQVAWNKGKKGAQVAWNKGLKMNNQN
jgi:hypothetical protein